MAGVVDPASPEGMLRSNYGGDATGLSSVKNKPEDDRNILEQVRNYLTTGINEDARYALGPNAAPAVTGLGSLLGELVGPGADVRDAVTASGETTQAVKEGDILGAGVGGLNTLASLAMMALPGSLGGAKKGTEEVTKQVKRYIDEPVDYTFTTGRGSTYEAFPSGRTQRNKASGHKDGGVGLQDKSEKTIFTDGSEQGRKTASDIVGISKNDVSTQILPILNSKEEVIGIKLVHGSNLGPKKAGDTILQMPVSTKPNVGKQPIEIFNRGTDVHLGSPITKIKKEVDKISVFPKPERMFPEGQRPKGGEYLNPKTGDVLTNKNVESASISITPEGKPKFDASPTEKESVGSPSTKGATQIKTNLFKKSAGWKWLNSPQEYKDIPTLVSVQNKGKHYYTLEANFPEGVNLTRYANSPSEPRLRPTVKGFVDLGKEIGKISVRGKEHPVYDKIVNRYAGGSVVERNPYANYKSKAI
tara:strand:+ start:2412 stop:3833 length:1422 start_codon:yes stop_codon:yes gene_type:complete